MRWGHHNEVEDNQPRSQEIEEEEDARGRVEECGGGMWNVEEKRAELEVLGGTRRREDPRHRGRASPCRVQSRFSSLCSLLLTFKVIFLAATTPRSK
jgi:hypothetical protein